MSFSMNLTPRDTVIVSACAGSKKKTATVQGIRSTCPPLTTGAGSTHNRCRLRSFSNSSRANAVLLAPAGSTLMLEQPEIHLHPFVQAGLADVFIDVIKTRDIQIILESHSEHLLRRLQRRIAEDRITPADAALYFVATQQGASVIDPLQLDLYGNISNWPHQFFGDELGELAAMTEAAMLRQASRGGKGLE